MEKAVGQSAIPCVNMIPEYRSHFGEKRLHPEERSALALSTRDGSRVPELGTLGSGAGALSNERHYRDLPHLDSKVVGLAPDADCFQVNRALKSRAWATRRNCSNF
jgi:hypothetical protein